MGRAITNPNRKRYTLTDEQRYAMKMRARKKSVKKKAARLAIEGNEKLLEIDK